MSATLTRPKWWTGRHPFGMKGWFEGMTLPAAKGRPAFRYTTNEKQYIAHNCGADEIFYGGAVYGGKTFFLLFHNAAHCLAYGQNANTVVFRRTYDELEGTVIADQVRLFDEKYGTYNKTARVFHWKNGAITCFRHLEKKKDVEKHQGRNYTLIAFDELTQFEEKMYTKLWGWLRSARDKRIRPQMLSGSNPRGIGHWWVFNRFLRRRQPVQLYEFEVEGFTFTRIWIPAFPEDNVEGMKNDPGYLPRLKLNMSPEDYEAYRHGDWRRYEGIAFPEWRDEVHVCEPFNIPKGWKTLRSFDYGYAKPFSVGWWAQDPDSQCIYRVNEWYGCQSGRRNQGLKLSVEEIRAGIENREEAMRLSGAMGLPWYGVADPSIWSRTTEIASVGERLNRGRPLFRAGNNDRLLGKQTLHSLLRINPETGQPGVKVFNNCPATIETLPHLVLDETMEDVETRQEDHLYDERRYALVEFVQAPAYKRDPDEDEAVKRGRRLPVPV